MPKFKHYDYKQFSMVVINYEEQLHPGTFKELEEKRDKLRRRTRHQLLRPSGDD